MILRHIPHSPAAPDELCRGSLGCCSPSSPCAFSEGDCTDDADCLDVQVCGHRNCADLLGDGSGVKQAGTAEAWEVHHNCCTLPEHYLVLVSD